MKTAAIVLRKFPGTSGRISVGRVILFAVVAFLGWEFVTNAITMRNYSIWKGCVVGSMRPMSDELAKLAKQNGRPPTSLAEIVGPGKAFSTMPVCPAGGAYSLVIDKDDGPVASCSIHGSYSHPVPVDDGHGSGGRR